MAEDDHGEFSMGSNMIILLTDFGQSEYGGVMKGACGSREQNRNIVKERGVAAAAHNRMKNRAYIDIETTGLSRHYANLTVIGIALEKSGRLEVVQLVEAGLSEKKLLAALHYVDEIYSYNGSRFDLPFIRAKLGVDLKDCFKHTDLMYNCWRNNLKGGLKAVERQLGIDRHLKDVDGYVAVKLWYEYINNHNEQALKKLLAYNREDVVNLRVLRRKLAVK